MTEVLHKKLVIDLDACDLCYASEGDCAVECAGLTGVREQATFALVCRRCEHASCIVACPFNALERMQDGGVIKRHNLRCVSCKLCAQACPFGTIYPEMLPFYQVLCDGCGGAAEKACVASCRRGALEYREVDPQEPGVHIIDQYLAARVTPWVKREAGAEVAA
jgi:Fe-S-cluster-containing hydrogenase component 2